MLSIVILLKFMAWRHSVAFVISKRIYNFVWFLNLTPAFPLLSIDNYRTPFHSLNIMSSVLKYRDEFGECCPVEYVYDVHMNETLQTIFMYINACLHLRWDELLLPLYRRHSYGHALYVYDHVNFVGYTNKIYIFLCICIANAS